MKSSLGLLNYSLETLQGYKTKGEDNMINKSMKLNTWNIRLGMCSCEDDDDDEFTYEELSTLSGDVR